MNLTPEQWDAEMARRLSRIHELPSAQEIQRLNIDTMTVGELAEWVTNRYDTSFESGNRIASKLLNKNESAQEAVRTIKG